MRTLAIIFAAAFVFLLSQQHASADDKKRQQKPDSIVTCLAGGPNGYEAIWVTVPVM